MKKGGLLLLLILILVYGYQAYQVVDSYKNDVLKIKRAGKLTAITEQVIPVPLEIPDSGAVKQVTRVRRDGDSLFMISDNRLLQFNMKGQFINQIAGDIDEENGRFIVEYVLNTHDHQVLVVDSERNINTFDYDGRLISSIRIDKPWLKISALTFHNGFLWATAETLTANKENPELFHIEHNLYQLDLNLNELFSHPLRIAGYNKNKIFNGLCVDELLVDEQGVYAYFPLSDPDKMLNDTLHIAQQKKMPFLYPNVPYGMACIYPVRTGKRYYLSTNYDPVADKSYTFCYDDSKQTAYMLTNGFTDDFYKTGQIADLQPMDIYNDYYCYLKSGQALAKTFPERAKNSDLPVLFILKLNV